MAKTTYYKLSKVASIFYDPKNKLKVTRNVPGVTTERTKQTITAEQNGHIIQIGEAEYNTMMEALPNETKKASLSEAPKPKVVPTKAKAKPAPEPEEEDEDEEEEEEGGEEERTGLLERLDKLKLSKKELKKVSAYDDEELKEYLEANEEEGEE